MEREYTDQVYNRLSDQIDEINMTTISPLTDGIGDIFLHVKDFLGLVDLENIKVYQKELLDKTDVTKSELKKIFQDVENVDQTYSRRMEQVTNRQEIYLKKLVFLSKQLKPNLNVFTKKSLKKGCEKYNKSLSEWDKRISEEYDHVLSNQAAGLALEGARKGIGGVVSGLTTIFCMPVKWAGALYTRGPKGLGEAFVLDTWSLINDVFDVGSGLGGAAGAGFLWVGGHNKWINSVGADSGMGDMEKMISEKGLAGVLESQDGPQWAVAFAKGMDSTTEILDIKNKIRDLHKSPQVLKKEEAFKKLKKWSKFREEKEIASTIKKIYKVGENGFDLFHGNDLKDVINKGIATAGVDNLEVKGFKLKDPGNVKDTVGAIFGEDSVSWKDIRNVIHDNTNIAQAHANK